MAPMYSWSNEDVIASLTWTAANVSVSIVIFALLLLVGLFSCGCCDRQKSVTKGVDRKDGGQITGEPGGENVPGDGVSGISAPPVSFKDLFKVILGLIPAVDSA